MPLRVDPSPHNFNLLSRTGISYGVLVCKISILRQKLVICATRAGASLCALAFKISVLRQKFVIIYETHAGAILSVLAC